MRQDCSVATVGQRAGLAGAETGDVVLFATEGLGVCFDFERAEVAANDAPHQVV